MKEWLQIAVATVFLLAVTTELFCEGKIKKTAQGIMKIVLVSVVLLSAIGMKEGIEEWNIDEYKKETTVTIYDTEPEIIYAELYLEKKLEQENILCRVEISVYEERVEWVDIYLGKEIINEKEGNIYSDSEKVLAIVEECLGIDGEKIRIYG